MWTFTGVEFPILFSITNQKIMNATRAKYKTWDATIEALEKLEAAGAGDSTHLKAQIATLSAELAAKTAENKALKAAAAGQQNAPVTSQAAAVERPLAALSKRELSEVLDTANANGDKAAVAKIWAEYSSR
jgi:hypothetical protein